MKKILNTLVIVLCVGLFLVLTGSCLLGIEWTGSFSGVFLGNALTNIGYIVTILSGVALTGTFIASVMTNPNCPNKINKEQENKKEE